MKSETSGNVRSVGDDATREALLDALAALCDAFPELTSLRRDAAVAALRRAIARGRLKSMIRVH